MRRGRGFTLLEIMVALAVFALTSAALVRNATLATKQTAHVRDTVVAHWIAENELAQRRAGERVPESFPSLGTERGEVTMGGRDWEVVTSVESTENQDVRRLSVSVFAEGDDERPLAKLTGFQGRY